MDTVYSAAFCMTGPCDGIDNWNRWSVQSGWPQSTVSGYITPWEDYDIVIVGWDLLMQNEPPNGSRTNLMIGQLNIGDTRLWLHPTEKHRERWNPPNLGHPFPARNNAGPNAIIDLHGSADGGGAMTVWLTMHYVRVGDFVEPPPPPPPPPAYTTLNPADKSTRVTLSNGNRTATGDGWPEHAMVRSIRGISPDTGSWFMEFVLSGIPGGGLPIDIIGLQDPALPPNSNVGGAGTGVGIGYNASNGAVYSSGFTGSGGIAPLTNSAYGIHYNSDTGVVEFIHNNAVIASRTRANSATLHPATSFYGSNPGFVAWNFGQSPFANEKPPAAQLLTA